VSADVEPEDTVKDPDALRTVEQIQVRLDTLSGGTGQGQLQADEAVEAWE